MAGKNIGDFNPEDPKNSSQLNPTTLYANKGPEPPSELSGPNNSNALSTEENEKKQQNLTENIELEGIIDNLTQKKNNICNVCDNDECVTCLSGFNNFLTAMDGGLTAINIEKINSFRYTPTSMSIVFSVWGYLLLKEEYDIFILLSKKLDVAFLDGDKNYIQKILMNTNGYEDNRRKNFIDVLGTLPSDVLIKLPSDVLIKINLTTRLKAYTLGNLYNLKALTRPGGGKRKGGTKKRRNKNKRTRRRGR